MIKQLVPLGIVLALCAAIAVAPLYPVIVKKAAAGGGGGSGADWSSYFITMYNFDSADGENNQGGTCSTDCNLTEVGTVPQDTTTYVEGTASRHLGTSGTYLYCTAATCNELTELTGDFSIVTWVYLDSLGDYRMVDTLTAVDGGYRLSFEEAATDVWQFLYCDGAVNRATQLAPATAIATGQWYHVAATHDDGTGQAVYSKTGASQNDSNSGGWTDLISGQAVDNFQISTLSNVRRLQGNMDEVGIYPGVLSANAIARICACGIKGTLCTHNGTTWTDEGRDATMCGGALGASTCVNATSPADCT